MRHPDIDVVRRLEEAHAQVSILDLILVLDEHCKVLLKVLGETRLPRTVTTERFDCLVSHILDNNIASFTDDDILAEGTSHQKPLHIVGILSGFFFKRIDEGSTLNICMMSRFHIY